LRPENEIENEKVINRTEIHDNNTTEVKSNADNAAILQVLHALESKVAECHMEYTHIIDALIETIDQLKQADFQLCCYMYLQFVLQMFGFDLDQIEIPHTIFLFLYFQGQDYL
jgi:cysteinyl-tRNA synthetase